MNVSGAVVLNLIDCLKKQQKGWLFEPLVIHPKAHQKVLGRHSSGLLPYRARPNNSSPFQFFIENATDGINQFIKIKAPNEQLRIVEVDLNPRKGDGGKTLAYIRYWQANGFLQNDFKISSCWQLKNDFDEYYQDLAGYDIMQVQEFYRVVRRRLFHKHQWQKPKKTKKMKIQQDLLNISEDKSFGSVSKIITQTIKQSFNKYPCATMNYWHTLTINLETGTNEICDRSFLN